MLKLNGGDCEGIYWCKRAPVYLRAVIDFDGTKDVLDLVDDTPKLTEKIHVYELEGEAGWMHIHGTKIHGFYATGEYHHLPEVDGEAFRDTEAWQKWALSQMADGD